MIDYYLMHLYMIIYIKNMILIMKTINLKKKLKIYPFN